MLETVQALLESDKICLSNDLKHCQVDVHGAQRPKAACVHPLFDQSSFVAKKLPNNLHISELYPVVFKTSNS